MNKAQGHRNNIMYILTILNYMIDTNIQKIDNDLVELDKLSKTDVSAHIINNREHPEHYLGVDNDINIIDVLTMFSEITSETRSMFFAVTENEQFSNVFDINLKAIFKNTFFKIEGRFPNLIDNLNHVTSINALYCIMDYYTGRIKKLDNSLKELYKLNDDDMLCVRKLLKNF